MRISDWSSDVCSSDLVAHGISLVPPDLERANEIDRIIYEELARGKATRMSERTMKADLTTLAQAHVQAAVLACTELEMIVDVRANVLPIYGGTSVHAMAAVQIGRASCREGGVRFR